jgi:hypothetical protein
MKISVFILFFLSCKIILSQVVVFEKTFKVQAIAEANSILENYNGEYLISGTTYNASEADWDYCLLVVSISGDSLDCHIWGGDYADVLRKTIKAKDSTYICAGYTYSVTSGNDDIAWMRLDDQNKVLWEKIYGTGGFDYGLDCISYNDSMVVITGGFDDETCILKSDLAGNVEWCNTYSNFAYTNYAMSVALTPDMGLITAGLRRYLDTTTDVYVVRVDSSGNEIWANTYGIEDWDAGFSIQLLSNNHYLIAGQWDLNYQLPHIQGLVLEIDDLGYQYIEKNIGGINDDAFFKGIELSNGNYLFVGTKSWDAWLVVTDIYGDLITELTFGDSGEEQFTDVIESSDHSIIATGIWADESNLNNRKIYVVKIDSLITECSLVIAEPYNSMKVFPNPSASDIYFEVKINSKMFDYQLKIYNLFGECCFIQKADHGRQIITLPRSYLNAGVYIAYLTNNESKNQISKTFILR